MKQSETNPSSLEKALKVLLAFKTEPTSWGVRQLSAHLGFNPATVQRILKTLKTYSFVDQDLKTRKYRLGNVYFSFLHILQSNYSITRLAQPFMKRLSLNTEETVHLETVEDMNRLCIDTIESSKRLKASMPIGSKAPLYSGATSKCLLAFSTKEFIENYLEAVELIPITRNTITNTMNLRKELEWIRKKGYATSLGELTPGLGALSAPLMNHRGDLLAALSLAIPERRYVDNNHREFCMRELINTVADFSKTIGYHDSKE